MMFKCIGNAEESGGNPFLDDWEKRTPDPLSQNIF
jgi:hypothetical protein